MWDQVRTELESKRFIVARTSFDQMDLDETLRQVVQAKRGVSPVADLISSYPDLFAYPRRSDPRRGCLLGVLATGPLPEERVAILQRFFPADHVAVFSERSGEVTARFLLQPENLAVPLRHFVATLV